MPSSRATVRGRQLGAVADQQQPRRTSRRIAIENATTASTRFTGRKFEMWMTTFVSGATVNRLRNPTRPGDDEAAVEKIGNHRDLARDPELAIVSRVAGSPTPR